MERNESVLEESPAIVFAFYIELFLCTGIVWAILRYFWGDHMLVGFSDLMKSGSVIDGLASVWFIFAWALVLPLFCAYVLNQRHYSDVSKATQLGKSLWVSLCAGVFEEVIYRGFAFMAAMVVIPFINFITFGLVHWLYVTVLIPLANFMTFHALAPQLLHQSNWVFGAAVVSACADFSDDHKHLGLLGRINSWFLGMVMFYIVFHYGLGTAMAAHAIYDFVILAIVSFTSKRQSTYLVDGVLRRLRAQW